MISYMPFTVLEERQLKMLTETFGTLTVFSPANAIIPRYMRSWQQQGKLEIRLPQGVDEQQLLSAIESYKSWADLHQDNIGDLAGFFQSQHGRIPMMDDTNPTQISHQIRHYGESPEPLSVDPLFKAALFLSMAQEYDLHQFDMVRDMDSVHTMEQKMIKQLSGDAGDIDIAVPVTQTHLSSTAYQGMDDPYMTAQRVREWSRLALSDSLPAKFYFTLSKAVVEHIKDLFCDVQALVSVNLASPGIEKILNSLASESNAKDLALILDTERFSTGHKNQLILYRLAGISPIDFLAKLSDQEPRTDALNRQDDVSDSTILGWVKS